MYEIILADPAWSYRDRANAGKRGACYKYPTMDAADIAALNVPAIAADDCALFLWATAPLIETAATIVKQWGFTYKTIAFTWIKTTKHGKLNWGMGNWTRANPEFVLLGTRGSAKRASASIHSVIMAPIGAHSVKPPIVREKIVQLMGDKPRVELFARERVAGWDAWGNEVDCDVDLRPRLRFNPIVCADDHQQDLPFNGGRNENE